MPPLNIDTTCSQGSGLNFKNFFFIEFIPDFLIKRKGYYLNIPHSPIKSNIEMGTVLFKKIHPDYLDKWLDRNCFKKQGKAL